MWRLVSPPKTLKATRKLASEFDAMEAAPHDRPLSERRLMVYERIMRQGGFRPVSWARARCLETGGTYRINGKHTSRLISTLKDVPELYVVVEEYECDTLHDVAQLYATFDAKSQSRTARDIYLSFAGVVPELRDLPAKTIALAIGGIAMAKNAGERSGRNRDAETAAERAEALLDNIDWALWMAGVLSGGSGDDQRKASRHLQRIPVAAAMYGTWQKAQGDADAFWASVRDGSDPDAKDPTRVLERYLLTTAVDAGQGARRARPVLPREMYVKCIHAWNAWRKDEGTSLRYHADADVPRVV